MLRHILLDPAPQQDAGAAAPPATPPAEPTPATEPSFNLDAFRAGESLEKIVEKPATDTTKPAAEPAKTVDVKPAETKPAEPVLKPIEPPAPKEPAKPAQTLSPFAPPAEVIAAKAPTLSRDEALEGFSDADRALLKKVPNEVFNYVVPRLQQLRKIDAETLPRLNDRLKQLESAAPQIPHNWFEHPEAYRLTPAFAEAQSKREKVAGEYMHWREQLAKIEAGQEWDDLDVKDGKIVTIRKSASTQDKIDVMGYMNQAQRLMSEQDAVLGQISAGFQQQHQRVRQAVASTAMQLFPDYKDDKHPSMPVIKDTYKYLANNGLGDNILAPLVAMMYARLTEYKSALEAERQNATARQTVQQDAQKAGPVSSGIIASGGGTADDRVYSLDMFRR